MITASRLSVQYLMRALFQWGGMVVFFSFPGSVRAEEEINFDRDIRPILSENCFHCHGPDAENRSADLRLDEQTAAMTAIAAGDRHASELFVRITSDDEDSLMPPPDSNRKLTAKQIELLGRWIDSGAPWGQLWSFTPIVSPPVPDLTSGDSSSIQNPIDAFIRFRLEQAGLTASPEADKRTLIRRVTLDLTGLPPTPEEVDQFLADRSPQAYERLVDRLLGSTRYGERMAWEWLDAARYADSNGYQGDLERTMWPWRDWVVGAFNSNLPYDDFTVWQLAGDLLPEATFEQRLATGFCRNHMINGEGGRIAEENRVEYVMDMAETTGTLWLGLTFNCCRCHDHKFDPLSQEDYYSLFAFFNQTPVTGRGRDPQTQPAMAVPTEEQRGQLAPLQNELAVLQQQIRDRSLVLSSGQTSWEQQQLEELTDAPEWFPLKAVTLEASSQQLDQLDDLSILASGPLPDNDTYTVITELPSGDWNCLRLDALQDESHSGGGLSRNSGGNFVLTEIELTHLSETDASPIQIQSASASYEQGNLKIENTFDRRPQTGWAVYDGKPVDRPHAAVFCFRETLPTAEAGHRLKVVLRHDSKHARHNLGRFKLSVLNATSPFVNSEPDVDLRVALITPPEQRTAEQSSLITNAYLASDQQITEWNKELESLQKQIDLIEKEAPMVMVMEDLAEPRETFLLDRGLYSAPMTPVTANVPAALPALEAVGLSSPHVDRLALARWIVSDKNPLTARVVVNRFWQQVFGIGLVKTPEDFGVQGERPSHPELLDWLAADFRDSGWDVKRLMKQLVMSATYRQSSKGTTELYELDPENRLLARGARYRLPFWMIRDQVLAASGLLTETSGGPAVNVYQPPGVWEEATFGTKKYEQDHGEALYRRSLYVFWRRIIGPTFFFDNASRQTCTVKVYRTNTPLHSLLTMNDVTYLEAARVLAERVLLQHGNNVNDVERLNVVYRRVLGRVPKDNDRQILLRGLNRTRVEFSAEPEQAELLLSAGEFPRSVELSPVEHASWTAVCLAIFNLDETLSKE